MQYTAIYVRQSADRADSVSLEMQETLCRQDTAPDEPVRVFRDGGYSGGSTDRPALREMLRFAKAGKLSRILVYKLDRISRNLADFTQLLQLFRAKGIAFQSHTERFETASPMGQAMQSLLMVFAQLERETIRARVRDAAFQRARLGFDPGGLPPAGFTRAPSVLHGRRAKMLIPAAAAEAVRDGFRACAAGQSLAEICRQWNAAGFLTQRGHPWSAGTLCRVLRNPVYVQGNAAVYAYLGGLGAELCVPEPLPAARGILLYADRRVSSARMTDLHGTLAVTAQHTGIVAPELWLRCQEQLTARRRARTAGKGQRTWLSGMIFCRRCGSVMTVTRGRSADYLICGGRKRGKCPGAGAVWRTETAERLVGGILRNMLKGLAERGIRSAVPDPAYTERRNALILRREAILRQLADPEGGEIAALAEAAARLERQCAALDAHPAAQTGMKKLRLPEWEQCGGAARRQLAALLLRGIFAEGDTLYCIGAAGAQ